ncbi:hypothetical protein [Anaerocolumna sp.]|uniref:hypothetical protein n=1 Tax=Anaerocolumna sp. TaxID=2041569 RepID=UPI0028ADE855|nr:hypothetical protein [Anaerocolumna sp.]
MDTNQPHIVLERVINTSIEKDYLKKLQKLQISVEETSKEHEYLLHYCNLDTLGYIINDRTLKCSSLNNVNLNDRLEAKRNNIERFAGSRFIACFSHCPYEIVPFWVNYGGKKKNQKVVLKFKNFASAFEDVIHMDYCLTDNLDKMFFYCDEYGITVNNNGLLGQLQNSAPINIDYDTRDYIQTIKLNDVKYLPISDEVFTKDYKRFTKFKSSEEDLGIELPVYDPTNLGRHKTNHWDYEKETRIICIMSRNDESFFQHIYLRLKEKIFQDLEIIMNPWAPKTLATDIQDLLDKSSLSGAIKKSVKITKSELHGQVKIS